MLAAFALGAEGVQIGSRFVASNESSAHPDFKQKILEAGDGDTMVTMKGVVRLVKNLIQWQSFYMNFIETINIRKCKNERKITNMYLFIEKAGEDKMKNRKQRYGEKRKAEQTRWQDNPGEFSGIFFVEVSEIYSEYGKSAHLY